ncbi:MAG: glyoxalase superfamily protein [Ginsengibacter sp.]
MREYQQKLVDKKYKYGKPGIEETFYGTWRMDLYDPFGNRLTFNEPINPNG